MQNRPCQYLFIVFRVTRTNFILQQLYIGIMKADELGVHNAKIIYGKLCVHACMRACVLSCYNNQGRRQHIKSGGAEVYVIFGIDIYQNISWNKCA